MTVKKSTATLGGYPLLDTAPVSWSLRGGVQPVIQSFNMTLDNATSLFNGGANKSPVTLTITPPQGKGITVTNLWVLNLAPGPNPYEGTVTVADRRWFWSYAHMLRRFNMRRRVGNKIVATSDNPPIEVANSVPNYFYWPWSLNNGVVWNSQAAVQDIMTNPTDGVLQKESQYWGTMAPLTLDQRLFGTNGNLPIEGLQLDDAGDGAVQRMLKYLPEADVTVDYDGTVIVFCRTGGDEEGIYKAILPEIPGGGHAVLVSNAQLRPSKINVKFTIEAEVRFDALENANAVASGGSTGHNVDTQTAPSAGGIIVNYSRSGCQNVLPSVDYQLSVNGNIIPMGTYIPMDDAFISWGNLPVQFGSAGGVQLDHPLVQKWFVPYVDYWGMLNVVAQNPQPSGVLLRWPERIAAVKNHYRQTFMIPSAWTEQMISMRAYRVATIDPQTGMRGPSLAYGDYCAVASQRQIARSAQAGYAFNWGWNRTGYPTSGIIDNTCSPSPAIVSILDEDQGVFRVDYVIDLLRRTEIILPSMLQTANNTMPSPDMTSRQTPITFDCLNQANGFASLSPSFKLAVILTCVPSSPNNINQLYSIPVSPSDVQNMIGGQALGLTNALGPEMDIHCGLDTARVMWLDSRSSDIEAIFGLANGAPSPGVVPNLQGLVVNSDDGNVYTGPSLMNLAQAEAARIYASLVDHWEGTVTGYMNGNVHLNGMTSEILHTLHEKGETTTQLTLPSTAQRIAQRLDVFRFLNSTSRAAMLKLVQPQGGA